MNAHKACTFQALRGAPLPQQAGAPPGRDFPVWLASVVMLLCVSAPAWAQVAPSLGSEAPFAIVSDTYTNTVAGTAINGNLCFTTGPVVAPTVTGTTGPCPAAAGGDQAAAIAVLTGQPCTTIAGPLEGVIIGANPPGTFPPGCYTSVGALGITVNGIVTLNGNGVYVFRSTGGGITTGANSAIVLAGGACAGNVFWTGVGATTLGGTSSFVGTILDAAGVTMGLGATLSGRALAFGGTVTTNGGNTITVPVACAAAALASAGVPTISDWARIMLAALLAFAGFAALRRRTL
jgi:Ice-binding-like